MPTGYLIVSARTPGAAIITVTASDAEGLSASQVFAASVSEAFNRAPVISTALLPADGIVIPAIGDSAPVDLNNIFSDPDGDNLTFMASSDDSSVATVSLTGLGGHGHGSRRRQHCPEGQRLRRARQAPAPASW